MSVGVNVEPGALPAGFHPARKRRRARGTCTAIDSLVSVQCMVRPTGARVSEPTNSIAATIAAMSLMLLGPLASVTADKPQDNPCVTWVPGSCSVSGIDPSKFIRECTARTASWHLH